MFYSIKELVEASRSRLPGNVAELMIATEYQLNRSRTARSSPPSWNRNLEVMKASVEFGLSENKSHEWLNGWRRNQTRPPSQKWQGLV